MRVREGCEWGRGASGGGVCGGGVRVREGCE